MGNLISISNGVCSVVLNPAIKPVIDLSIGLCFARLHIFAHLNSWITVAKHYTVCKQCGVCKVVFCDDTIKITLLRTFEI